MAKELNNSINEDLIWLALDQLKKENLIENSPEMETKFEGVSRREVIKKIGLSSMIALPVVVSLIAPTAAYVQASCNAVTCSCTGPRDSGGNCTSTTCATGCTCRGTNGGGDQGTCRI
ncbi:MAG: hypothetical protein ACR2IA_09630 [Pyrinomonadaceae bacterium]